MFSDCFVQVHQIVASSFRPSVGQNQHYDLSTACNTTVPGYMQLVRNICTICPVCTRCNFKERLINNTIYLLNLF